MYRKLRGLARRLKLAGAILSGRSLPDLEAVLLHSTSMAIEVERLSTLYESLAVRIAGLEQVAGHTLGSRLSCDS
jgi:hypothetical protein